MLTHALRYAALGWPVFPCTGKAPLIYNGFHGAVTDEKTIRDWWTKWPNANIGLATGHKFFVFDVDNKKHEKQSQTGLESLEILESKHGKLPDTIQQITGSGGRHYLFAPYIGLRNSSSKVAPGIDIRGEGGYIIAEPSIHPETLQAYRFDGLAEIEDQEILPAPQWLLEECFKAAASQEFELPEEITPGNRNDILFRQASNMRGAGMCEPEIFEALLSTNTKRVNPPLPTNELRNIAKSVMRYLPNDIRKKSVVRKALNEHVQSVTTFSSPGEQAFADNAWAERLDCNCQDIPFRNIRNVRVVLEYNPHWHGVFRWNAFTHQIVTSRSLCGGQIAEGQSLQDYHVSLINSEIQAHTSLNVGTELIYEGINIVARCNSFHPVRDYLAGLNWDGDSRIDSWLFRYLSVAQSNYSAAIARKWLISAIARVMAPGCKADCCLILEGPQGIGKSTALAILGGLWFTDAIESLSGSDKDTLLQLRGKWIVEIPELSGLSRGDVSTVKAFMSRSIDKFREPYGRISQDIPRECVFAGTVNGETYLKDETGNRRFWPVKCGTIDLNGLVRDRDQLWAEAYQLYQDGELWHINDVRVIREAEAEQAARVETDAWHGVIEAYCQDMEVVTIDDVLNLGIRKSKDSWNQNDKLRVGRTLRQIGYSQSQRRINGRKSWVFVKGMGHSTDVVQDVGQLIA
jgi:predicted P-loop ATPase